MLATQKPPLREKRAAPIYDWFQSNPRKIGCLSRLEREACQRRTVMLRRSAKLLSLCRKSSSASSSQRFAETLPVPVSVSVAWETVFPSPVHHCAQSARLLTTQSACFFHLNYGLHEVDLNYRYKPGESVI